MAQAAISSPGAVAARPLVATRSGCASRAGQALLLSAEINGYVKEKEGTRWPIKHPVLDALRATDWCA